MNTSNRVAIAAVVLLATVPLGVPVRGHASPAEFPPDPGKLELFGYSIYTNDTSTFTRYLRETSKFSNVVGVPGWNPDFGELMVEVEKNDQKAIVSLHLILFEEAVPGSPENDWVLRDDYEASFLNFVAEYKQHLEPDKVAAFYPADEPYWNGISEAGYNAANELIKKVFDTIPTFVTLSIRDAEIVDGLLDSLTIQGGLEGPIPTDWVGHHRYGILDPATDSDFQESLAIVKSHMTRASRFFYILDGYWSASLHGAAGIQPSEMDQVAQSYYQMARADSDAIGLAVFVWDSFAPSVLGTRDLPENVLREHIRIGSAATTNVEYDLTVRDTSSHMMSNNTSYSAMILITLALIATSPALAKGPGAPRGARHAAYGRLPAVDHHRPQSHSQPAPQGWSVRPGVTVRTPSLSSSR